MSHALVQPATLQYRRRYVQDYYGVPGRPACEIALYAAFDNPVWLARVFRCPDGEAKFWLDPKIELAHMNDRQLRAAQRLIKEQQDGIRDAWRNISQVEVSNVSKYGFWLLAR